MPEIFVVSTMGLVARAAFSGIIGLVLIGYGILDPLVVGATILGLATAILIGRDRLLRDIDRRQSEN